MRPLINAGQALERQSRQYSEKLIIEDSIPAQKTQQGRVAISHVGHFYCEYITGDFETLYYEPPNGSSGVTKDSGICSLKGQLRDSARQITLFNDYIPFNLLFSPGRVKSYNSQGFLEDPPSGSLFYPFPFEYIFEVNNDIVFDVKNEGTAEQRYRVVFHGCRLLKRK